MEVPLAAARSPSGRRWNPSDNASSCAVDTAPCGLLRVRVWRFPRPKVRSAGGCLARLRHESQPTLCHTQGLARDSAPSNPKRPALRWSSRAGASPPFPPWRRIPMGKRRTVMVAVRVSPGDGAHADVDGPGGRGRARAHPAGLPHRQQSQPDRPVGEHAHSRADLLLSLNLRIRPTPFPPIDSRRLGIRPELSGGPRAPASAVPRRLSDSTGGRSWPSSSRRVRTAP